MTREQIEETAKEILREQNIKAKMEDLVDSEKEYYREWAILRLKNTK